jgi:hypothetical protein
MWLWKYHGRQREWKRQCNNHKLKELESFENSESKLVTNWILQISEVHTIETEMPKKCKICLLKAYYVHIMYDTKSWIA